jgi:flagellar hook-basal body complex protein FliE
MEVPKVGSLQSVLNAPLGGVASGPAATGSGQFLEVLKRSLEQVNQAQSTAESKAQQFELGQNNVTLEDAVISQQKANIAFQETIQVRNKLVAAYTDIMNMQI